jgi:hypothetical protein
MSAAKATIGAQYSRNRPRRRHVGCDGARSV